MPDFFEKIRETFSKTIEKLRRRMGLIRVFRIYCYVVRVSGYVLPPKEVRKKEAYKKTTCIQFELSFEEYPYFRTFTPDFKEAKKRYERELRDLVSEQERRAMEEFALTPTITVKAEGLPKGVIFKFLSVASKKAYEDFEKYKVIRIPGRPSFVVEAVDFEPVEYFDVEETRIKEGKAIDNAIFKLYRPLDEIPYTQWDIKFLHDL